VRLVDARVDAKHLPGIRAARAQPGNGVGGRAAPEPGQWLILDVDATSPSTIPMDKEKAAPDLEEDVRPSPAVLCSWTAHDIAGGEALARAAAPCNAGSNTAD